ncbi:uncharacterized protein LOC134688219 [Mytilus trossulus]|uniref:uncharacterized protein LOC134688219 n=1 Tax=Mytilus trossulus TaxID=6551 RepID=UPI0030047BB7
MTDCQEGDENTQSDKLYKFLAVKELRAADFIFLAEEEVKEETIRKIHAKNIERSIPKYTIASFTKLNKETEKVADYCFGKIAINVQQKKGSESHFTDLQEMHVAQFGSKTVTALPGKTAKQYFCLKNLNDLSEIFNLFCNVNSMVLIINSKLINIIQSFQVIKCVIYVHFINSVDKKNLKRKFHAIEEE